MIPIDQVDACFRGFVTAALVDFKKTIQGVDISDPATPEDAIKAYKTDPDIFRFVESILSGANAIYKS